MQRAHARLSAAVFAAGLFAAPLLHASEETTPAVQRHCEAKFDEAQRTDMESFRDYDADTFRAIHTDDAVTVFASGASFIGIDAIMTALRNHFERREAVWSWTERYRSVQGCKSAFILYETTYAVPRVGFNQRALTGVTYVFRRGAWYATADQSTLLPATP